MAKRQDLITTPDQRQLVEQLAIYLFENNLHTNNRSRWNPTWPDIGCNVRGTWRQKARQALADLKGNGLTISRVRNFVHQNIRKVEKKLKVIDIKSDSIETANLEEQQSISQTIYQMLGGKA